MQDPCSLLQPVKSKILSVLRCRRFSSRILQHWLSKLVRVRLSSSSRVMDSTKVLKLSGRKFWEGRERPFRLGQCLTTPLAIQSNFCKASGCIADHCDDVHRNRIKFEHCAIAHIPALYRYNSVLGLYHLGFHQGWRPHSMEVELGHTKKITRVLVVIMSRGGTIFPSFGRTISRDNSASCPHTLVSVVVETCQ